MKEIRLIRKARLTSMVRLVIVATTISHVGCSPESSRARSLTPTVHIQNEGELTKVVSDYIRHTRGWPDDVYIIQLNSRDGSLLIFWVLYKGDDFRKPGGGGRSFEAVVNPESKRVEKELHFQ